MCCCLNYSSSVILLLFAIVVLLFVLLFIVFFFNDTATTQFYTYLHTLSLHDALPISTEHDLDAIAAFFAPLVVFYGLVPYFPARDAGRDPLFLQGVAEPVGIIASVGQHPLRLGQTVEQSGRASVIADLASGHEEADGTAIRIGHSMQLGVHAAFRTPDQASRTPFFTRRLDAVRCALR